MASPMAYLIIDANNVRGHTASSRGIDEFCNTIWRWHQEDANAVIAVWICIDHGTRRASYAAGPHFWVSFSGPFGDADTDVVQAVDRIMEEHASAPVSVVTNDQQLRVRCHRHLPELAADAEDEWYQSRGLQRPGSHYEREWTKGAPRPTEQLTRLKLVGSEAFAQSLEADGANLKKRRPAPRLDVQARPLTTGWCWWLVSLFIWAIGLRWLLRATSQHGPGSSERCPEAPFAMGAEAMARRAAHESRRGQKRASRKHRGSRGSAWRHEEASQLQEELALWATLV